MLPICGAIFEQTRPDEELTRLDVRAAAPDFWKDPAEAQKVQQRRRRLEQDRDLILSLKKKNDDLAVLIEWAEAGEPVDAEFAAGLEALDLEVQAGEIKKMLGGEHDRKNAIITIHPGAGGTESQDWAEMLLRMYHALGRSARFQAGDHGLPARRRGGAEERDGDGHRRVRLRPARGEAGVHRLVRISPFDQAARRHTSFASLYVWPELPEDVDIVIEDKDLRIDTYRSSGAGGQHVNVTDSAVRLTHLPTGLVVSCQNERSQHRNKDSAMKVLKARLYDIKMKENQAKLDQISGIKRKSAFGSQIRSYVLHPYQLAKDHRTGVHRRRQPRARRRHRSVHQVVSDEESRTARSARSPPTRTLTSADDGLSRRSAAEDASRGGGHALLVGAGILLSRLAGLIRQRVFSHYFGLRYHAADAFTAGFRIPISLQNLFGEGALSASFIPVYAALLARGERREADRVAAPSPRC